MNRRTLYLPIETKSREMPGKTLLAARAVDRGWRVFLGGIEMHHHMAEILTPGLLIENNIPDTKSTQLHHLKNRGYRIADLCEESIIYPDAEDYCGRKVGPRSLEATDLLLATGARCEQDIREHRPAAARKLIVTGNPRFDTLMPHLRSVYEDDAREIRQRYGRFLLVNTNFSSANPFKAGLDVVAVLQRDGKLARPAMAALKRRQVAFKARQMKGLQSLLAEVAKADVFDRIILRPHPSENHDTWRAWASNTNIEVQYQGSASAWMLAADMVLHPGCTTGIEALLLDRPVVSFVPEPDSEFVNQADVISVNVASAEEFIELAPTWRQADGDGVKDHVKVGRSALRLFIDNVEPPLSADRILDALDEIDVPETGTPISTLWPVCGAVMNVRRWSARREVAKKLRKGYRRQKFPGLLADDVRTPIARWVASGVVERMPSVARVDRSLLRLQ